MGMAFYDCMRTNIKLLENLKFNDIIIFKLLIKDQWVSQEINGVRDNEPVLLNIFYPINVKITIIIL